MKIVFLDAATMGNTPLTEIEKLGELTTYDSSTAEEARERVKDADVALLNKIIVNKEFLDAAPKLKLICEAGTGMNNIDLKLCEERGVAARNVAGYSTDSVAQITWTLILALSGRLLHYNEYARDGRYASGKIHTDSAHPYTELAGKTIGIVGMGAIGTKVAKIAEMFGMKVIYYSTSGTSHCKDYPSVSIETLLKEADVVSIHAPYNERTAGLIDYDKMLLMKPCGTQSKDAFVFTPNRIMCVEIDGSALLKSLKRIAGWTSDEPRICPGIDLPEYSAVCFDLTEAFVLNPAFLNAPDRVKEELEHALEEKKSGQPEQDDLSPESDLKQRQKNLQEQLKVECFGNFEVYWKNMPLMFGRRQTKELLAFLVDRRGPACTPEEIAQVLWQNQNDLEGLSAQVLILLKDLKRVLDTIGREDIIISRGGKIAIRKDAIDCDYYRMLAGDMYAVNSYQGEYMAQYTWAEITDVKLEFEK